MKIIKYNQFLKESNNYDLGCVMIEIPISNWEEITSTIVEEDLYTDEGKPGIQDNPHVTLLYGLHNEVTLDQIKSIFDGFEEGIDIIIKGIGIFENENFDVVKLNVLNNNKLQSLYDKLSELPNSNEYPEYIPHITIAYLKKGCGNKYKNLEYKHSFKNVDEVCYSISGGSKEYFSI